MVQVKDGLDAPFTKSPVPGDYRPVVILQSGGQDLRSRGGKGVDQDQERAVVKRALFRIPENIGFFSPFNLEQGTAVNEETGNFQGIVERTAAVIPQVQDDPVHPFPVDLLENPSQVRCGAAPVHIGKIPVERREINIAVPPRRVSSRTGGGKQSLPGVGLFQNHNIADDGDGDDLPVRFLHRQPDLGAFLAPDISDRLVDPHIIKVHYFFLFALGYF